jgi:hypothetical protein
LYGTWSRQGQCLWTIGGLLAARGYVGLGWLVQVLFLSVIVVFSVHNE